jgi:endonuclease YncB( thermonuclease family)
MRRALVVIIVILGLAMLIWWVAPPTDTLVPQAVPTTIPADAVAATIDYVHDGDTLFLTDGTKVRLLAVDTPEVGDNLECLGNEATDYLRTLLPEGSTVYTLADAEPTDQYGRSLLFIWTSTGTLVNLDLVEQGYAEAVFIGSNRLYEAEIEAAEDAAQGAGRGIWGGC